MALADRDLPADAGVAVARLADASDLGSLWTNETGGADAFVTLGAWAAVTERIVLGTGVVPLSARSEATLALAARQVARMADGRLILGIGVGQRAAAEKLHGTSWRPPVSWVRDALGALRGKGFAVIVGALGPRMLEVAAESADGVLLNWFTPAYVSEVRERIREATEAAGRDPSSVRVSGYVRVAVGSKAREALAEQVRFYSGLPFYREHWAAMGDPDDGDVTVASVDGSDLREQLSRFDGLDDVVARIVPTEEYGVEAVAELLCRRQAAVEGRTERT